MAELRLQEQLAARLEEFARELLLVQADRACDLFSALIARDGTLMSSEDGRLTLRGARFEPQSRDYARIVNEGTGMTVMVAVGPKIVASVPRDADVDDIEVPAAVATSCYVRGDAFADAVVLAGEHYFLTAKPLDTGGTGRAMVLVGARTARTNDAMLGLTKIQADIIQLSEELQVDREQAVSDFLKAIRNIAKRIHLLALNASILSAQAGEQGRGFAVVAREIGELAERTRQSAHELESTFDPNAGPA